MLQITCPWCGPREEMEFRYGGEGAEIPKDVDDARWARVLYYRTNPAGTHVERWVHAAGCRQWFVVERNTLTHGITATHPLPSPDGAG
jgi:sarcosine oxidase, subunit delta